MTPCSFQEFYLECVDKLTDTQLRTLNPYASYYKTEAGYCGLLLETNRTWISVMVGGMPDIWALRTALRKTPLIGFLCRVGSPTYRLAIYYGATITDSGEKYPDGAPAMRCLIHTEQTKRLQKVESKSQALT